MPPEIRYTKEEIIEEAFNLVKEKGISKLSARSVAKRMNMSMAPIYSSFKSMNDLSKAVIKKGKEMAISYTKEYYTDRVFLNIGTGVVLFARDYPNIYKALFIEGEVYKDVYHDFVNEVSKQMTKDPRFTTMSDKDRTALLNKMWIFTHGLASLTLANLVEDTTQEGIVATLLDMGGIVITAALSSLSQKDDKDNNN